MLFDKMYQLCISHVVINYYYLFLGMATMAVVFFIIIVVCKKIRCCHYCSKINTRQ